MGLVFFIKNEFLEITDKTLDVTGRVVSKCEIGADKPGTNIVCGLYAW